MRPSVRYTLLRLLLFLACLLIVWLLGLRHDPLLLVLVAAVVSMIASFFLLSGMRRQFSEDVAERVSARQRRGRERRAAERIDDAAQEDAEDARDDYR